jgi:hypothetical protein
LVKSFRGGVFRRQRFKQAALGWLYVRTGSLWGPIGLHAAFNGFALAGVLLQERAAEEVVS